MMPSLTPNNHARLPICLDYGYHARACIFVLFFILLTVAIVTKVAAQPLREVIYLAYDEPKSWDPAIAATNERDLLPNLYETLLRYQPSADKNSQHYTLKPSLATSWQRSEDGKEWTFQLRRGVKFHDGTPFNALAVKIAIERTRDMNRGTAYIWYGVKDIEVVSEYEVKFICADAIPLDLIVASQYGAYIYSPQAAGLGTAWFNQGNVAGTGPYQVSYWQRDYQIILTQNKDYWRGWPRNDHVEKVKYRVVRNGATQSQMMLANKAHFITSYAYETLALISRSPGITIQRGNRWTNLQVTLNHRKYPTDNVLFRKALQHAWDYQGIAKYIFLDYITLPVGPVPASIWGADKTLTMPHFDLDLAKQYLKESGVPEEDWRLTMSYTSTNVQYGMIARATQQNLAKIGVQLELLPGPWNAIAERARKLDTSPHMMPMMWWPTYATPSDFLWGIYYTEDPPLFNLGYYSNPKFDALIDAGRKLEAVDRETATKKYQQAQRILIEDAAAIHVGDYVGRRVYSDKITGLPDMNPAYSETVFFYDIGLKTKTQ